MPKRSATSRALARWRVVQAEPRPRDRSARQKLQAAWITESNRPRRPLPSWVPQIVGMTMAGRLLRTPGAALAPRAETAARTPRSRTRRGGGPAGGGQGRLAAGGGAGVGERVAVGGGRG